MDLDDRLDERADYVPFVLHQTVLNELHRATARIAELEETVRSLTREAR